MSLSVRVSKFTYNLEERLILKHDKFDSEYELDIKKKYIIKEKNGTKTYACI